MPGTLPRCELSLYSHAKLEQRKDPTASFLSGKALMLLQQQYGLFPRIMGKGDNARRLADLLLRMRKEVSAEESGPLNRSLGAMPSSAIDNLIIIDREVDFATVLLTQLTYEGLVDELVGIQNNRAEVDSSIVGSAPQGQSDQGSSSKSPVRQPQQSLKRTIQLDSSDKLFEQLRDTNFAIVGSLLNKVARRLESDYKSRLGDKSTSELREFVNKLPGYQAEQQSLKIHTNLAEEIMKQTRSEFFSRTLEVQQNIAAGADPTYQHDTIEEMIARDVPLPTVLRLLCLESCISGGLRPRDLENFKRQILHAYGYQHLLTLDALEKMELLQPRTSANALLIPLGGATGGGNKTNYNNLRKFLRLIVDEVNEQDPNDIAYVYSGYAPLSIRIVQCAIQKQYLLSLTNRSVTGISAATQGWQGFDDVLKSVQGETFDIVQKSEDEKAVKARQALGGAGGKKTTVVFFLGGITFTEIAALRFIAKQEEGKRDILICTTGIVSGAKMMDAAIETGSFGKS